MWYDMKAMFMLYHVQQIVLTLRTIPFKQVEPLLSALPLNSRFLSTKRTKRRDCEVRVRSEDAVTMDPASESGAAQVQTQLINVRLQQFSLERPLPEI